MVLGNRRVPGIFEVSLFLSSLVLILSPRMGLGQKMIAWEPSYEWLDECTLRLVHKSYFNLAPDESHSPFPPPAPIAQFHKHTSNLKSLPLPQGEWQLMSFTQEQSICPSQGAQTRGGQEAELQYADYSLWEAYYFRDFQVCEKKNQTRGAIAVTWQSQGETESKIGQHNGRMVVNLTHAGNNAAPVFAVSPLPFICSGQSISFSQAAVDQDGDSLSFALINPPNFQEGYSSLHPLGNTWKVAVDGQSGELFFKPEPFGKPSKGYIFLRVFEWREGQLIGSVERSVEVEALEEGCIDYSGQHIGDTEIEIAKLQCNTYQFTIKPPVHTEEYLSYEWFGDGGLSQKAQGAKSSIQHTYPGPGTYFYRVKMTNIFGCAHTIEGSITVEGEMVAYAGEDRIICSGETIQLGGTYQKGYTYNWAPKQGIIGAQLPKPTFQLYNNSNEPDTLDIKLETRSGSCSAEDWVRIVVAPAPQAEFIQAKANYCQDDTIQLALKNTSQMAHVHWETESQRIEKEVFGVIYKKPGAYTVKAEMESIFGCTYSLSHSFAVHPIPSLQFDLVDPCAPTTQFMAKASFESEPLDYVRTWNWDFGDGTTGFYNRDRTQNPGHTFSSPGTYDISLTILTNKGCMLSQEKRVTVFSPLAASFELENACENSLSEFVNHSQHDPKDAITYWHWDFGDGDTSNESSPMHSYTQAGNYRIMLALGSEAGCSDTLWKSIPIHHAPLAQIEGPGELCLGDTLTLFDKSQYAYGNMQDVYWQMSDPYQELTDKSISYRPASPGDKEIFLIARSDQGCQNMYTHIVQVYDRPNIDLKNDFVCLQETAQLSAASGLGTEIYWYESPQSSLPIFRGNSYRTQPLEDVTTYYVQAINEMGCSSQRLPVIGATFSQKNVRLLANQKEVELPKSQVQFSTESSVPIDSWQWDFGDGNYSNLPTPTHSYSQPGNFTVEVMVREQGGCELLLQDQVSVREGNDISMPTAFSPNGDGTNDYFSIYARELFDFSIQIYDDEGKVVFRSKDPGFKWFGTDTQGDLLNEGIYVCVIEAKSENKGLFTQSQSISLIR